MHESVSLPLFLLVWIFPSPLRFNCYNRQVLSEGHKNHFRDQCLINLQWTFLIFPSFFDSVKWWCYEKYLNQITSSHTTLWILDLPIFNVFVWILLVVNLFLNQTPLILLLYMRQTWKIRLTEAISWWGSLCEGRTCFCVRLTLRKFWAFLFMFSTGFILFGFLFLFHQSINVLMFVFSSCCLVLQAFSWLGNCDQVFWLSFYWLSLRFRRAALFLLYRWW